MGRSRPGARPDSDSPASEGPAPCSYPGRPYGGTTRRRGVDAGRPADPAAIAGSTGDDASPTPAGCAGGSTRSAASGTRQAGRRRRPRSTPPSARPSERLARRRRRRAHAPLSRGAARQPAPGRDRRRHPRPPGRGRGGRDRARARPPSCPKICLELGRGVRGMIGHTQPRRLAARTVAERIAEELDAERGRGGRLRRALHRPGGRRHAGQAHDRRHPAGRHPPRPVAARPTTRSSSTRPTSAASTSTSSSATSTSCCPAGPTSRSSSPRPPSTPSGSPAHFDDAPIIEVSGRTYPVEVRYRPAQRRAEATATRCRPDRRRRRRAGGPSRPGDVLVFLAGEREIRDAAEALRGANPPRHRDPAALRPALRRPSSTGVRPHRGRRIVLATNVAETSLTVPGIRYVVDPGTARMSRYSHRLKVQRLPIEAVSQASANQRAGRCGRVAPGVCIRLYDEEDFEARPGVHRARDPAHQPGLGHPADGGARPRRRRRVPVPRPARPPGGGRRRAPAGGAGRAGAGDRPRAGRRAHPPSAGGWPACPSIPASGAWCSKPSATAACARC